ncbi:MAG: O-methyltransferase [Deltaproteobacteria bacterium]|nr:O-methyltransferase [Deltaproteobacteria bacterium]
MSTQIPRPKSKPPSPFTVKDTRYFDDAMEQFCVALFGPEDEHLIAIRDGSKKLGFPPIAITPMDGQILSTLVRATRARRAVEIGTLGGYSALWIARALEPGALLDCMELDVDRAHFALEHLTRACPPITLAMHVGPALDLLENVLTPVDFVFVDADKENYPRYLEWAAKNLTTGGIVAFDNAFAWGHLRDPDKAPRPAEVLAIRETLEKLGRDTRFKASMIPTNEGLAVGVRR